MQLREATKKISEILKDKHKRAIASLKVFLLGCYQEPDKTQLILLRDNLRKRGIEAFLMEDIEVKTKSFKSKFDAIWAYMSEGINNPLFILYAGSNSHSSSGFIAELVDIANDKNKLDVAHLYQLKGITLPHHAKCYINCHTVPDTEAFHKSAMLLIDKKIESIKNFLEVK